MDRFENDPKKKMKNFFQKKVYRKFFEQEKEKFPEKFMT